MVKNFEVLCFFYHFLNAVKSWIAELYHLVAFGANEVIVLAAWIRFFELRLVLPKLMLGYQIAIHKQIERVVHRGPAYPVVFVFHRNVERLHIEVAFTCVNLFQNSKTLRSLP